MTAVCVMAGGLGLSASAYAEASSAEPLGCADFRCDFGDVPKAAPPLIVEPFVSFYRDQVVMPMRPYHDWEPSTRKLPNTRAGQRDTAGKVGRGFGSARESSLSE